MTYESTAISSRAMERISGELPLAALVLAGSVEAAGEGVSAAAAAMCSLPRTIASPLCCSHPDKRPTANANVKRDFKSRTGNGRRNTLHPQGKIRIGGAPPDPAL